LIEVNSCIYIIYIYPFSLELRIFNAFVNV